MSVSGRVTLTILGIPRSPSAVLPRHLFTSSLKSPNLAAAPGANSAVEGQVGHIYHYLKIYREKRTSQVVGKGISEPSTVCLDI